ncbi:MAG: bifunctional phosphoribosyl-AMP cyclohydrolase/phosphoribosyl-ATP diphosphatase HisIE [Bacteroidia bacterium]|nr:bifunctional phosphoribosyl-AMP cyclohydrolase/phosphoribosyl-ATP diphosphatase HisIE [Bacteroidia bacterium]
MTRDADFNKGENGLIPAIVQDSKTRIVLMMGYMNKEALAKTQSTGLVTFFSRSKQRLWTKGESSGHVLKLVDLKIDCDKDTILIKAKPQGPTCHTGSDTCWDESNDRNLGFLSELEGIISQRQQNASSESSYVASLFEKGINKIAQKVGEEAVETVIEAKDSNDELFLNESADLVFHLMVLLRAKGFGLDDVVEVLENRHK